MLHMEEIKIFHIFSGGLFCSEYPVVLNFSIYVYVNRRFKQENVFYRRNRSVPAGPNLTGRRNGTIDEHKHLDRIYGKQICSYFLKEHLISVRFF